MINAYQKIKHLIKVILQCDISNQGSRNIQKKVLMSVLKKNSFEKFTQKNPATVKFVFTVCRPTTLLKNDDILGFFP